ncbi:MAG: 4-phosphoerythronate dehydrogenase [Gammaproteobacteria bacterium]|nr:4-phosphoerythronate dehydrogenase [Gammaproteobacteria bacterium]
MKIVADENITLLGHYFGQLGTVIQKPGRAISHEDILDADILLVRSVTPVNAALLQGSSVKFVGSVTTGIDHLDTEWLNQAGIHWASAKGCNANAVVEYIICTVAALQKEGFLQNSLLRAGIIGAGRIGNAVAEKLKYLNFEIIFCDPFRTDIEQTPFEKISDCDLISFHTPLTMTDHYPTYHMVDREFLARQKKDCILLNTARGAVINSHDLKYYGRECIWCLDVWENEPTIDFSILESALIATPHIAGYSVQAKNRGTEMIFTALSKWLSNKIHLTSNPLPENPHIILCENEKMDWQDVVLKIFDPRKLTEQMQFIMPSGYEHFDWLRKNFTQRQEFSAIQIKEITISVEQKILLEKLGVQCI